MAADNPGSRDDTLTEAIEDAQRKARDDERWAAHLQLHDLAAKLRSEFVDQRWSDHDSIHLAHHREHDLHDTGHTREHEQTQLALDKAEHHTTTALDKAEHTVSLRFDSISKVADVMRDQVTEIQRGGARQEGKGLGQGTVVAIIVGSVGLVGTILGIVVILANFISSAKP